MPKIGPNKVSIDPKVYAARVTSAKKRVAQIDPAIKTKIKDMYPKISKESIAKQALGVKKTTPEQKRMQSNMSKTTGKKPMAPRTPSTGVKKPMPKIEGAKPGVKKNMPKTTTKKVVNINPSTKPKMPLTGPAAIKAMQDRVSPAGVKKAEAGAKKAIDKKYPGLYKKSK
jgi:hypothetical protein